MTGKETAACDYKEIQSRKDVKLKLSDEQRYSD
jgi:hypothetical protein